MLMNWQILEAQVSARLSALEMQGKRKEGTVWPLLVSLWEPVGVVEEAGQRGAEMQVPSGEFSATKGLEVEGREFEHDGNRGSLLTRTQRGGGRAESLSFSNSSSICNPLTDSFLFRQKSLSVMLSGLGRSLSSMRA